MSSVKVNTSFLICMLLCLPIIPSCGQAKDSSPKSYYIGKSTGGDGTINNPFYSFDKAMQLANAGDSIIVFSGEYQINSRITTYRNATKSNPIIITAYNLNNRPILKRGANYGGEIFLVKHQYYNIDGFIIDGNFAAEGFNKNYYDVQKKRNEKSYRSLVVFAHHAVPRKIDEKWCSFEEHLNYNGNNSNLTNCEIKNNRYDGVLVHADNITIKKCNIHHILRGTPENPKDAHGISCSHMSNLKVTETEIHHVSGDCIQADPDIDNKCNTKLWDSLFIENCLFYTSPLKQSYASWPKNASPGENAVDTKTYLSNIPLSHRPLVKINNIEVHGFSFTPNFNNRSVFNIKFRTDWQINGVKAYNNEIVFRIRGDFNNLEQGGATVKISNILCYNNQAVFYFESQARNVEIHYGTFVKNDHFSRHGNYILDEFGNRWGVDKASFTLTNSLFINLFKPYEAIHPSNILVSKSDFIDFANNDFHLSKQSIAINKATPIESITQDITGKPRKNNDSGAFEY